MRIVQYSLEQLIVSVLQQLIEVRRVRWTEAASQRAGADDTESAIDGFLIVLWAYYNCDTSTIRVRFDYNSSAIQHPTRSYVLSSNNEHVNSFPLL